MSLDSEREKGKGENETQQKGQNKRHVVDLIKLWNL